MQFDEWHHPIPHPVYHTTFIVRDVDSVDFLYQIEPWASFVLCDNDKVVNEYIQKEQPNTNLHLSDRLIPTPFDRDDVVLEFSQKDFIKDFNGNMNIIQNLSQIISESGEPKSEMELGIFKLKTDAMRDYSKDLAKLIRR